MTTAETVVEPSLKRIAIQGEKGAFHEIAARQYFGERIELDMCETFPHLFRSLAAGKADYGVVAIENSVAGTLLPNYALLRESSQTVIGEVYLRIAHNLMAPEGTRIEELTEVYSHPMALRQCQKFFEAYPHIRLVEHPDTAGAARWVSKEKPKGVAAIASELAAQHYDLTLLAKGIEDNPRNFTRFLVVLEKSEAENLVLSPDKASLCFNLGHQVGSLSQILLVLSSHGMNLTKIQSLPIVGSEWQYFFHIDLEYANYEQYKRSLAAIEPLVDELKILGEYPRGDKSNF